MWRGLCERDTPCCLAASAFSAAWCDCAIECGFMWYAAPGLVEDGEGRSWFRSGVWAGLGWPCGGVPANWWRCAVYCWWAWGLIDFKLSFALFSTITELWDLVSLINGGGTDISPLLGDWDRITDLESCFSLLVSSPYECSCSAVINVHFSGWYPYRLKLVDPASCFVMPVVTRPGSRLPWNPYMLGFMSPESLIPGSHFTSVLTCSAAALLRCCCNICCWCWRMYSSFCRSRSCCFMRIISAWR